MIVAGNRHAHAGGIALGQGLQSNVVFHGVVILSQLLPGRLQQPQPILRLFQQFAQLRLFYAKKIVHGIRIIVVLQNSANGGDSEAHVLQRGDAPGYGKLIFAVIPVAGKAIDLRRPQQAGLIVMAQHADADSGQLREFSNFQHTVLLQICRFSELTDIVAPPTM